jgi:hypothetical protein
MRKAGRPKAFPKARDFSPQISQMAQISRMRMSTKEALKNFPHFPIFLFHVRHCASCAFWRPTPGIAPKRLRRRKKGNAAFAVV